MRMSALTELPAWQALVAHRREMEAVHLRDLFGSDPGRFERFQIEAAGIFADFSKQRVTQGTMDLLAQLARERDVASGIDAMFSGAIVNPTEQRAALHVALRNLDDRGSPLAPVRTGGTDVMPDIAGTLMRIGSFCAAVHAGEWRGWTGERITDVVNIGIGGSDLGPRLACEALRSRADHGIRVHFVSNVDGAQVSDVLAAVVPQTTLFIVTSKTFTTTETLANAQAARRWLLRAAGGDEAAIARHFVAVSTNRSAVEAFGIDPGNMFGIWDWVGGRYSLWSAVGLSIALLVGIDNFRALLAGANAMDRHFREAPLERNLPVIMALLGVWNINFLGRGTLAVIPYAQDLAQLPAYLQQLEMESNGKSVDLQGRVLDHATAPVIWGEVGTNGQHAFFQLLHQGGEWHPVDFILPLRPRHGLGAHHRMLVSNCLAQAEALMLGKTAEEARLELSGRGLGGDALLAAVPHRVFPGNRPSSLLMLDELTPATLGALLALYEHKVYVQGLVWNVCSFDQWGVELGKQLAGHILHALKSGDVSGHDGSTAGLVMRARRVLGATG
jgi:glucose-6-phosphate isomerase